MPVDLEKINIEILMRITYFEPPKSESGACAVIKTTLMPQQRLT